MLLALVGHGDGGIGWRPPFIGDRAVDRPIDCLGLGGVGRGADAQCDRDQHDAFEDVPECVRRNPWKDNGPNRGDISACQNCYTTL